MNLSVYPNGVTVISDPTSPTGCRVMFVCDPDAFDLRRLGLKDVASVMLYSDCMKLYRYEEQGHGTIDGRYGHEPEEYAGGLYPAGGSGDTRLERMLQPLPDGRYGCEVVLPCGAYVYNYQLTDSTEKTVSRLSDPANPAAVNPVTGVSDLSSMVYVPYDAAHCNTDRWADRRLELPKTEGPVGETVITGYPGADGTTHGLCVYLPAGYDAHRPEPYPVLYLSHGTGFDLYGEEMRWMHEGAVKNINDNLGVNYVVVCMNNQEFSMGGPGQPNWDFRKVEEDQLQYIMPWVEAHWNVSREPAGRAYAGLSMGGATTSNFLMYHGELFSHYGIWSFANVDIGDFCNVSGLADPENQQRVAALKDKKIMLAYGSWDFGLPACRRFGEILDTLRVPYTELEVPSAHDWNGWQLMYAWAAQNFFWKA